MTRSKLFSVEVDDQSENDQDLKLTFNIVYEGLKLLAYKNIEIFPLIRSLNRVPTSRMGGRAFSSQVPLLCNHLPVWVYEADTLSMFKSRLKSFLFDKAYG